MKAKFKKASGKFSPEEISKAQGGELPKPDLDKLRESHYAGRTKKLYDQKRGVPEIRDVVKDDYDHQTVSHDGSVNPGGNPLKIQKSYKKGQIKEFDGT